MTRTESAVRNLLSRKEFVEQTPAGNARIHWLCWGGRIRTSDWLIQSLDISFCHARWTCSSETYIEAVGQAAA